MCKLHWNLNTTRPSENPETVLDLMIRESISKVRDGSCDATSQTEQGQSVREFLDEQNLGKLLLIYICNFHVLSHLLLIYICKLHWN